LTGFAGNLVEIAVLRFFVGLGMAFCSLRVLF
jgi:hypothetical protein